MVFILLIVRNVSRIAVVLVGLEHSPATFFVGGPDGMSINRQRAIRALLLVCPDIMFVAACLDQCPVGLVPFRTFANCMSL